MQDQGIAERGGAVEYNYVYLVEIRLEPPLSLPEGYRIFKVGRCNWLYWRLGRDLPNVPFVHSVIPIAYLRVTDTLKPNSTLLQTRFVLDVELFLKNKFADRWSLVMSGSTSANQTLLPFKIYLNPLLLAGLTFIRF